MAEAVRVPAWLRRDGLLVTLDHLSDGATDPGMRQIRHAAAAAGEYARLIEAWPSPGWGRADWLTGAGCATRIGAAAAPVNRRLRVRPGLANKARLRGRSRRVAGCATPSLVVLTGRGLLACGVLTCSQVIAADGQVPAASCL